MTDAMPVDSQAPKPRLRVALVLGATRAPAWWADVITAVRVSPDAEVAGVHVTGALHPHPDPQGGALLLRSFRRLDRRFFGRPGDPSGVVDLAPVLADIRALGPAATATDVDLVLSLGAAPGAWAPAVDPCFGTWCFEHPTDPSALAAPAGAALPPGGEELIRGEPLTTTSLIATVGPDRARRVLGEVVSRVDVLSLQRGSRGHLRKLPTLVIRALRVTRAEQALPASPAPPDTAAHPLPRRTVAVTLALLRVVVGYMARLVRRSVMTDRWVVGVTRTAGPISPTPGTLRDVKLLEVPAGLDWADPFPMRIADRDILFIEEYDRVQDRGWISLVELDDSERGWRTAETILDLAHHLSYPFVFEWEGEWYLMPEQAAGGSLEVYRAAAFPRDWRWHLTALPGVPAADPTLAHIDGRWWLFAATNVPGGNAADELHLYYAETPLGPWTPHLRNPVISDVRTARPAGRIYQRDGRWFRPVQDGTLGYGHSMRLLEITEITPGRYRECEVQVIGPDWGPGIVATHSINADGDLTAIDGSLREARPRRRSSRPRRGDGSR